MMMKPTAKRIRNLLLRILPLHFILLLTGLLPDMVWAQRLRGLLVRPLLKKCGKGLRIAAGCVLLKPDELAVGDGVYIAHRVWINAVGGLTLDDGVILSPGCVLDTSKHRFVEGRATHISDKNPISIGAGSWVAANSVVTDGVSIGRGSLVAAGSVVTHDVPDHVLYGGVPARFIRDIPR